MRTRLIGSIAIAALALTACGGDDAGGGGRAQDQVADMMIEAFSSNPEIGDLGVDIDEDCIRDLANELSDDDAKAIVDAGPDGNADVSAEAEAKADEIIGCIDLGSLDLGG